MIKLDVKRCYGASAKEIESLKKSIEYVNAVLAHPSFETLCLEAHFKETNGDTNKVVCDVMRSEVTIGVSYYSKWWSKVVGWTTLGKKANDFVLIHANRKFWHPDNAIENGSNILHELSHGFGYMHQFKPWFESVPYTMNFIYKWVMLAIAEELKKATEAKHSDAVSKLSLVESVTTQRVSDPK